MPASQFIGPILETGIQIPHYFNGRLLTAADLRAGQDASNTRQTWFGQSNGYGIANGLEISSVESDTKLHIAPGIGMNRQGQVIHLKEEISLPPLPPPQPTDQSAASAGNQPRLGQFAGIKPQLAAPVDVQATGVFLLTVVPTANGYKGSAATQIPAANTVVSSSGNLPGTANQWEVERASLKIIRLAGSDLAELYSSDDLRGITVNDKNRRNLVAHWCYGTLSQQNLGSDPFASQSGDSDPLDTVADLGESDIPLATFHWDGTKLTFVDMWSVRRRVIRPDAASGNWQTLVSDKRVAMNQARFLQFQDHLDDIIQQSLNPQAQIDLSKVQLTDYFTFLPPVGFLPTTASSVQARISQGRGAGAGTGKPGATGGGTPSNWWSGLVSEAGKVARAIDPMNWLHLLHSGVNRQAEQIQALQDQLARLSEQITSMQQRGLVEELQKQLGEITTTTAAEGESQSASGTPAEGDVDNETTHPLPKRESTTESTAGSSETFGQTLVTSERLFHDEIHTLLSAKQQTGPGFDLVNAFTGMPTQATLIGSDSIRSLLNQSWYQDAIDLRPEQPGVTEAGTAGTVRNELVRMLTSFSPKSTNIYLVAQNLVDPTDPVYTIFHNAVQPAVLLDTPGGQ